MEYKKIITGALYNMRIQDISHPRKLMFKCFMCDHVGYISQLQLAERFDQMEWIKYAQRKVKCSQCGNKHENYYYVVEPVFPEHDHHESDKKVK